MASSLERCLAGPGDECDWIPMDPTSTSVRSARFDTLLVGRRTHETLGGEAVAGGVRRLPDRATRARLALTDHRVHAQTGTALLESAVRRS